jgi:hypothetical protein
LLREVEGGLPFSEKACFLPFYAVDSQDYTWSGGSILMQKYYTVIDMSQPEGGKVTMGFAKQDASFDPFPHNHPDDGGNKEAARSVGKIVGISIGSIIVIAGIGYVVFKKRNTNPAEQREKLFAKVNEDTEAS